MGEKFSTETEGRVGSIFGIHCIIHIIDFAVDVDTTLAPTRTEAGSNEA